MAAYASVSNIQEEFKNVTFSGSTQVTDTRVSRFITEAEAEINAKVGQIYSVPVDGTASPNSFAILRQISIELVAARIKAILEVKTPTDDTSQGQRRDPEKIARARIDEIVKRTLPLTDAVLLSSTSGSTSYDVGDTTVDFAFKRATGKYGGPNQWIWAALIVLSRYMR